MIEPSNFDNITQKLDILAAIFTAIDAPIAVMDIHGQLLACNPASKIILAPLLAKQKSLFDYSIGPAKNAVLNSIETNLRHTNQATTFETEWITSEDTPQRIRWRIQTLANVDEDLLLCTGTDISNELLLQNYTLELEQRIKARTSELYRAKERVEAILNSSSDAIILTHLDGTIQQVNVAFDELFGYTEDEYFRLPITRLVSPSYIDILESTMEDVIENQHIQRIEVVALRKDGTNFMAEMGLSLIVDEESQLWGTVCTLRDITPRKKVEAALRTSEARYRAVVEDQTELIFRYQEDGTLTFVNDAYCRFFNKVAQDAIGRNLYSIISPEEAALFKKPVDNAENVVKIEEKIILESGEMRWVDWTKRAIVVGDRNLTEYQVVGRDITEIKQAEIELRRALEKEKELVELKSRFIATTSHEFRTPLATILATASSLQHYRHKMDDEQIDKRFNKINSQIQHLTSLLEELLTVEQSQSSRTVFNPSPLNLDAFCQEIIEEFQRDPDNQHHLIYHSELNGLSPESLVDKKLIRQMITNMISNAIKYSSAKSTVTIELLYTPKATIFKFTDEGIGIPPSDYSRLFEAFHRGANVNTIAGTGLGLAVVKHVSDLHKGMITFESKINQGTSFTISIPYRPSGEKLP